MDLESLLKAMNDAATALAAKPEDEALKKAAADAKKAYDDAKAEADLEVDPDESVDETKLDEKTKKYLAKLRKENANHRTKGKDLASKLKAEEIRRIAILKAAGIEVDEEEPEEKLKLADQTNSTLALRNAILESAVEQGIARENLDFYEFLVMKATNALEDGEELSDEALAEIVKKVKTQPKGSANSTTGGGTNPPPANEGADKITLEKFCAMSIMAKSALWTKNPDLYTTLMSEAKAKKKLV